MISLISEGNNKHHAFYQTYLMFINYFNISEYFMENLPLQMPDVEKGSA